MTRRHVDWFQRLQQAVEARARTPFAYGSHDCSLAAADLVLAVCDCPDPGAPFRDKYKTERGAIGTLRRYLSADPKLPFVDLLFLATKRRADEIGFSVWEDPIYAQRGDLAFCRLGDIVADNPRGYDFALGVVALNGREIYCAGEVGWTVVPQKAATVAWAVR